MMSGRSRFPFTANQWQELEHQALIFKYMASGIPIPHDLLFTIKTSSSSSSCLDSKLFPASQSPHIGWSCFQLGLGRKIDPEPGRCRRTDGKKWRCSKEAYPDSKYCERHMHRGKNRSRKPVEVTTAATQQQQQSPPLMNIMTATNSSDTSLSLLSSSSGANNYNHHNQQHHHQFLLSPSHAPRQPQQPYYSHSNEDYRSIYGLKEEHSFFSETSGSMEPWRLSPLAINSSSSSSSSSSKQRSSSQSHHHELHNQNDYSSYLQLQSNNNNILSDDGCTKNSKAYRFDSGDNEPQKRVHRFFDEWPPRNEDLEDDKSFSNTRLSISIPNSTSMDFGSRTSYHHQLH